MRHTLRVSTYMPWLTAYDTCARAAGLRLLPLACIVSPFLRSSLQQPGHADAQQPTKSRAFFVLLTPEFRLLRHVAMFWPRCMSSRQTDRAVMHIDKREREREAAFFALVPYNLTLVHGERRECMEFVRCARVRVATTTLSVATLTLSKIIWASRSARTARVTNT